MGLFGKKKTVDVEKVTKVSKIIHTNVRHNSVAVIHRPHITEKAAQLSEKNVYVFEVDKGANKFDIKNAIQTLYKVTPERIRVINTAPRHFMSRSRGRSAMEHGMRKAYVYLKKGDRIELV